MASTINIQRFCQDFEPEIVWIISELGVCDMSGAAALRDLWLAAGDCTRLAAMAADGNLLQKPVWRVPVVLFPADRVSMAEIVR